jgi:hypothetical protein
MARRGKHRSALAGVVNAQRALNLLAAVTFCRGPAKDELRIGIVPKPRFRRRNSVMRTIPILSVATLALGLFAAVAMPGVAQAQAPGQTGADTSVNANEQRVAPYMIMIYANGTVVQMPVDTKMTEAAMKSSKALGTPMVFMVANGKAYAIANVKMANGKMIYDGFGDDISRMMHERN